VANTQYNMALVHRRMGNKNDAQQSFKAAASIYAAVYGESHSETIDALRQAAADD
jgi:hypothetical protein